MSQSSVFVVCSLDRAFRSSLDALAELEKLHQRSIQFLSLSQNFDTTTPDGKFLYTLAAALATWEREILSLRTKEGPGSRYFCESLLVGIQRFLFFAHQSC